MFEQRMKILTIPAWPPPSTDTLVK